jgi:protein ImuB
MKRIVSVFLPHWPIERLQQDLAQSGAAAAACPADRPLALVESGGRGVWLSALNRAAYASGLHPGLALADARALLPSLIVRAAAPSADRRDLRKLARWLGRYGITRNAYGLALYAPAGRLLRCYGLWVDITGVAHLYGGEAALLGDMQRSLGSFGLTAHLGLADTLGAAHALAWHGDGATPAIAAPGETLAALATLPVAALRIEAAQVQLLHRLGFKQIGPLARLPRQTLERRFRSTVEGERVLLRLDQALGTRPEPRRPLETPPALVVMAPFADPLISSAALENEALALVAQFCGRLEAAHLGVRACRLLLYRSDGTRAAISLSLSSAVRAPAHLAGLLREKWAALDCGFGVDLLALEALRTEHLGARQQTLTSASDDGRAQATSHLIDRLTNRLGGERVLRLAPQASHCPERAQSSHPALGPPASAPPGPACPVTPLAPRPILLLAPPEPIAAMAEIPEGPPLRFTWRRMRHTVVRAQGPERIEPEWWRELEHFPSKASPRATATRRSLSRDYYALEDEAGARFWVFRAGRYNAGEDTEHPAWFIHGVFA